jgi:hypothetical protein
LRWVLFGLVAHNRASNSKSIESGKSLGAEGRYYIVPQAFFLHY